MKLTIAIIALLSFSNAVAVTETEEIAPISNQLVQVEADVQKPGGCEPALDVS